MKVQFKDITRGQGKIYMRLVASGIQADYSLSVANYSSVGRILPAMVMQLDYSLSEQETQHVIIVPIFAVSQHVIARIQDSVGQVVEADINLSPTKTAYVSKKNTFLHANRVNEIRDCDAAPCMEASFINIDHLTVDQLDESSESHAWNIIRGSSTTVCECREDASATVEISAYDMQANCLCSPDQSIVLNDATMPRREYPNQLMREVQFSIRVPQVPLVIWIHYPDSNLPDAIRIMDENEVQSRIHGFFGWTADAGHNPQYERWLNIVHRASVRDLVAQRQVTFDIQPFFSIIVPLYKTPLIFFREMMDSVLAQSYEHFEIVLVNTSLEIDELRSAIDEYCNLDPRVRAVPVAKNVGIVGNTQIGIEHATGDFLCFLDHDDIIEPNLLYEYAKAINGQPETDLLYCDEDLFTEEKNFGPFFKPNWSPDLLMCVNYITHLLCVRKSIVDKLDSASEDFEGAQDYHMIFRVSENARVVTHVPKILYHWRVHENSVASSIDSKPYALEAGRRAIQAHLERCNIQGEAKILNNQLVQYWVDYTDINQPPVSIIIPNKDHIEMLSCCISSILEKSTYREYEIVIVENNSEEDATFDFYRELQSRDKRVKVVFYDGGWNFSKVMNFGVNAASHDYLLFLNNDTEVISADWIQQMVGPCLREDVGMVGAKLYFADDIIQHAGVFVGEPGVGHVNRMLARSAHGYLSSAKLSMNYSAVTAACTITKRDVFDAVGGFDKDFPVEYNDVDLCFKIREKGYLIVFTPFAELYHYESISRGQNISYESKLRFYEAKNLLRKRWPQYFLMGDPYANPNLESVSIHT